MSSAGGTAFRPVITPSRWCDFDPLVVILFIHDLDRSPEHSISISSQLG